MQPGCTVRTQGPDAVWFPTGSQQSAFLCMSAHSSLSLWELTEFTFLFFVMGSTVATAYLSVSQSRLPEKGYLLNPQSQIFQNKLILQSDAPVQVVAQSGRFETSALAAFISKPALYKESSNTFSRYICSLIGIIRGAKVIFLKLHTGEIFRPIILKNNINARKELEIERQDGFRVHEMEKNNPTQCSQRRAEYPISISKVAVLNRIEEASKRYAFLFYFLRKKITTKQKVP